MCKEVFDLLVEGGQILFPVALSACPDDVQHTLNLLCDVTKKVPTSLPSLHVMADSILGFAFAKGIC